MSKWFSKYKKMNFDNYSISFWISFKTYFLVLIIAMGFLMTQENIDTDYKIRILKMFAFVFYISFIEVCLLVFSMLYTVIYNLIVWIKKRRVT